MSSIVNEVIPLSIEPTVRRHAAVDPARGEPVGAARGELVEAAATRPLKPAVKILGKSVWAIADQVLISGTNFVTMVVVARAMGKTAAFGAFTLAYSAMLFANILQGTLVSQPHHVLGTGRKGRDYARFTSSTALTQLMIILFVALAILAAAGIAHARGSVMTPLLIALAPATVAWQLQEFVRRVLYTENRLAGAFFNDVISYGGQMAWIGVLGLLGAIGIGSGPLVLYILAATSVLAAIIGIWQIRHSLAASIDWAVIRENWHFGKWLAGGELLSWCSSLHMYLYLSALILGLAASGELKAAQILFGPTRIIAFSLSTVLPIRFAKALMDGDRRELDANLKRVLILVMPILGTYCLLVAVFAKPLLRLVYGGEYTDASTVLVLYSACSFLNYIEIILAASLTARRMTRYVFGGYVAGVVIAMGFGWLLVKWLGTPGALVGMILTAVIANLLFIRAYRRNAGHRTISPAVERFDPTAVEVASAS